MNCEAQYLICWHNLKQLKKEDKKGQLTFFIFIYLIEKYNSNGRYIKTMEQINHGFANYYFLEKDGTVYDLNKDRVVQPDSKHIFTLRTVDNKRKKIALKTLYQLIFNEVYCKDIIQNLCDDEVWKVIDNTNQLYYISNYGRIKSLQGYQSIILKPFHNSKGYLRVDITQNGKRKTKLVHRLVAAAYLPLPAKLDMQLHHKDFNKNNNAAANLEWLQAAAHAELHKIHVEGDL